MILNKLYNVWQNFTAPKQNKKLIGFNNLSEGDIFIIIRDQIFNVVLNRFRWQNLPDNIPEWYIENTLVSTGLGLFFNEDILDVKCYAQCVLEGNMNIYGIPTKRRVVTPNGYSAIKNRVDSVLVFDSYNSFPTYNTINYYASIISRILINGLRNMDQQKFSVCVLGTRDEQLTVKNLIKDLDNGVSYIPIKNTFDIKNIQVLDTKVPYIANDLMYQVQNMWNQCLNQFGVEAYSSTKRERENMSESQGNIGYTEICRNTFLVPRKNAIEECKKMWGESYQDSDVIFNSNIDTKLNLAFLDTNELEVVENE